MEENKGNKTNFTNQNSSVYQDKGDREGNDIDSKETATGLMNSSDRQAGEASSLELVSVEDNSLKEGAPKDEGTTIIFL